MLKEETIKLVATLLKVKDSDLTAALKDDKEVDFAIPEDLTVLTKPELEARDLAQKNDGIKAGKEIGIKEVRTAAGLEESVGKDPKKVAEAITAKGVTDAKIPANEKVTEVTKQNELLTQKLAEKDTEIATEKAKSAQVATDRQILTSMPKNRTSLLEDDEMLDAIKSKHIKEVDGVMVVVGKDGQVLRDEKTTKPLDISNGLLKVFTERKWIDEGEGGVGGRGKKDEVPPVGGFSKKSEVIAHYEKQGKSVNGEASSEIVAKLGELAKANPDFDMNN